jgi:hypothetical protein
MFKSRRDGCNSLPQVALVVRDAVFFEQSQKLLLKGAYLVSSGQELVSVKIEMVTDS